jgi:DNA (cytosine-5)-methyltransferase 1
MKHGSLFSGIGGFDLAAEFMGWENMFHCEWNTFGQKILKHYWPNAKSFEDITKTDFTPYANTIDILTGGFPCQPYSLAGKRKGKEDERHLWPEMLRAIREIQPRWVVGENVFGLINWSDGLVFHEVQTDLEAEGYEVFPHVLPACAVNAPHRRDRVWFIAYSSSNGHDAKSKKRNNTIGQNNQQPKTQRFSTIERLSNESNVANPNSNGQQRSNSQHEINTSKGGEYAQRYIEQMGRDATNSNNKGLEGCKVEGITGSGRQKRNKQPSGYVCTNWQNFPTQSPICTGNDGLPTELDGITFPKWRNESIKAAGNAIVPQVALQIFKAIEAYESHTDR